MEITKEELQVWIREMVTNMKLISPDVLEKCNLLQSLLDMREGQAVNFLKLCESVMACEAVVRKQYALLGWEYRDTDSDDDDDNVTGSGNIPDSVHSETLVPSLQGTNGPTPLSPKQQDSLNLNGDNGGKSSRSLKREPVVVLTRLPNSDDSDDFDHCFSSASKRRKIHQNNEKTAKSNLTKTSIPQANGNTATKPAQANDNTGTKPAQANDNTGTKPAQANGNTAVKSQATTTSTPQASTNTAAKSQEAIKTSTHLPTANTNIKRNTVITSLPQASTSNDDKINTEETSTPQGNRNIDAKTDTANTSTKPVNTNENINVGMNVLARKRMMSWKLGKIIEIVKTEDGGVRYKINFEEKGKRLVSGHHIAFHHVPNVSQLYVGARVVVRCQDEEIQFKPGILAELPCRKNQSRFLVFTDDHTPVYVGLPLIHLVCRPLKDALDDIPDSPHKYFMKQYLKAWPSPHLCQGKVGQLLNVELNGVQQRCEVQVVDCSLIQVVFQGDQHIEWIHRGSIRVEHVAKFLKRKWEEQRAKDERGQL
ncbi:histone-lysine N-methyltransferase SETDB1-A-like [Scomber japonicus]|uniref:histone-lysine N-methyltransferase SETDB1-A-like n=1 Tax=Scomber japonicus TaxID=13676 RepID=UPI0023068948|nr:histone-lysine N-methyltransferase SETDB1-A-like [Scomber japonicus]